MAAIPKIPLADGNGKPQAANLLTVGAQETN
jgi:hypothetical protein